MLISYLYIRERAEDEARRGLSTFENMPFLHIEDALLEARRASSTPKKGMFLNIEEPLLISSSASSRMKGEMINEKYQQFLYVWLVFFLSLSVFL